MSRLQPRLKTSATIGTSIPSTTAPNVPVRETTRASTTRPSPLTTAIDPLSDAATYSLIRRTLYPSYLNDKVRSTPGPIEEILPPLTSSNEVDLQLYAIIAIIIREFVCTWYAKITPNHEFVEEVVQIIAHCTRGLEQRLRKVDLESLVLDEFPEILEAHIKAYRTATCPLIPTPCQSTPRVVYHTLWPAPALSPIPHQDDPSTIEEQIRNEAAYRQLLVHGVLAVLLPKEDLENDCLTSLVGQICSEMILGNGIGGKASEPWLIWEGITKFAETVQNHLPNSKTIGEGELTEASLLKSGAKIDAGRKGIRSIGDIVQKAFVTMLTYLFLAFKVLRFTIFTISTASSLPTRSAQPSKVGVPSTQAPPYNSLHNFDASAKSQTPALTPKMPILSMSIWSCASHFLDMEARMPWLQSTLSLLQWISITGPAELGSTNGILDRFLSHQIHTHILNPHHIPPILKALRSALFPNNHTSSPRTPPTPAEQLLIRRHCAEAILALFPSQVSDVYFHTKGEGAVREEKIRQLEWDWLGLFGDPYCNRHLMYGLVEVILVRIFPELGERGVEELLDERLG